MTPSGSVHRVAGRRPWQPVAVTSLWIAVVLALGGLATDIGPWYVSLDRPPWYPPEWLFGPAWLTIYTLTAMSAIPAWQQAATPARRRLLVLAYAVNSALNVLWSVLFFSLRRPDWALIEVALLALSVLGLMAASRHIRRSVWLLLPYLLWVLFAAALNLALVQLNAPFTASRNLALLGA
jgi:translocator protein